MDGVDAAQLAKAQQMMAERPTAKAAVKNYWMMVLANGGQLNTLTPFSPPPPPLPSVSFSFQHRIALAECHALEC